ncbi:cytochrome-c peroxidase [Rhodobacter capsulatus]|uniref:cytochrome-c peroxidase n=1 Tax=Rhodobacter capsulatus TaxID=1061 RepID=UPI0006DC4006|nr:cytochrome-c peroxidase [Rhodobacter capsulatus]KQB14606.1 cytochrome C peroxidase [Rhodobacter capsulatus]KQB14905.1 cytochrome C peroxidase [Rhodobacter capsulatus]PZX25006.1 cytochrome c peroxidase [Rhodobacter capsulatus]QNR63284.1 cytochrome-c peroxidase [Rhodobacter capsulatus]
MGTFVGKPLKQALVWLLSGGTALAADLPAPITDADFGALSMAEVRLGRDLFYDPILSGNRNISCATCHHPRFGTGDGLSLGLGEGAVGLGPDRHVTETNLPEQRIPRNAPALFNLGATSFKVLFHDGRIEVDPTRPSGLRTPMEEDMVTGFASILSAQTMFPVLSPDEMAGHYNENEISKAVREGFITGPDGAWALISARVAGIPAYQAAFEQAYPEIAAGRPIAFTDISNAIAQFVAFEWRSDDSAFDAVLRKQALFQPEAAKGADLFYGVAGCATCHSGPFLTDHSFHAMGEPQLGPGKAERFERHSRDEGRYRVTNTPADIFAFRTPSLRNVAQTGPWGHAGSHKDLAAFVADHARSGAQLADYDRTQAVLPALPQTKPDWTLLDTPAEVAAIRAAAVAPGTLTPDQVAQIVAFLQTLSDPVALKGRFGLPDTVPSGLAVDR